MSGNEPDAVLAYVRAWSAKREPFDDWVRQVSRTFTGSRLQTESAARLVRTTSAELEAVLRLATMDDEALALLNDKVPPKTTWFDLADATVAGVEAAVAALAERSSLDAPSRVVREAIRSVDGAPTAERIAGLDADVFKHLAKKATQYGLLTDKSRTFLKSAASRLRTGRPLTPRQLAYAENLIRELHAGGALRRESPDGDQLIVDQVIDALEAR